MYPVLLLKKYRINRGNRDIKFDICIKGSLTKDMNSFNTFYKILLIEINPLLMEKQKCKF